ncbi:MAG: TonB-dependent receptor [Acidobacteriota bacterium]|nr:TonB-dependent receptor [Acidobacteriota bacterium]
MLALSVVSIIGAQSDKDDKGDSVETEEAKKIEWQEHVSAKAEIEGATDSPVGASSTVLTPGETLDTPESVTRLAASAPGVSENGQDGLFQTISIRGVSRQRVIQLISGMRITSERRAGVSASFLDPLLVGRVEIVRGPATTFHGSGALGGVVQSFPSSPSGSMFQTGYKSDGDESWLAGSFGAGNGSISFAHRTANNAETAEGDVLNSAFSQTSAVFRYSHRAGNKQYRWILIPSYGDDIGKSNTDFPARTTIYPRERHQLLKFEVKADAGWRFHSYVHTQDLQTDIVEAGVERAVVDNDAFDFGVRFEREHRKGIDTRIRYGVETIGRRDVDSREVRTPLDPMSMDPVETFRTLDGADEIEVGVFSSIRHRRNRIEIEGGIRLSSDVQENGTERPDEFTANGFTGISYRLSDRWEVRSSISSGLRFASLTERFFSGSTGRGRVVGNPDLDSERSLNAEFSTRRIGKRSLVSFALYRNRIDDYIERVTIGPDELRSFVNLTSGTINGVELQGLRRFEGDWMLQWGGHLIRGEDDGTGDELADIPPHEAFVGVSHRTGRWSWRARLRVRGAKDHFAPSGEVAIPSVQLLSAAIRYDLSTDWALHVSGENLLDESYFRSADDKSPLAPGRAFGIHLVWKSAAAQTR